MTMANCFISRDENRKPETGNRKPLITILLLALLVQGGCGPGSPGPVVVFCSPDSLRMRQAIDGLQASLGEEPVQVVCVPEFGADAGERLRQVRRQCPRLLVVLGTAALRQVAPREKHTPVVFALVGNPYFTGAAYFPDHPEDHQENVTGLATPPPLTATLKQGAGLLGGGPWGLLYDPNDGVAVELAQRFDQEAPVHGIQPLTEASAAPASDGPGLERLLAKGARVIYLPPAPSAARYAPRLLEAGRRQKVMVVSGYPEGDHHGAVLWLAVDYRRLGEEAGALARRVLSGQAPKNIPIVESAPLQVQVDESLLRRWSGYPPSRSNEHLNHGSGRREAN